jgi:excisionase family DNA binding protein
VGVRRATSDTSSVSQQRPATNPCLLVGLDEAAQYLAVNRRTVDRLVQDGSLHSVKVLDSTRIAVTDLEEFVHRLRAERSDAPETSLRREVKLAAPTNSERNRKTRVVLDELRDLGTTFAAKVAANLLKALTGSL